MKVFKLGPDDEIDVGFKKIVQVATKRTTKSDDDYFLLVVGLTGSGKSTLGLLAYSLFEPTPSIDYVTLNRDEFVEGLQKVKNKTGLRFLDYDEAAVMSRDANTKWNKAVVKLYMRIRHKRIFHIWCNPSPLIDRLLIEEKINGIVYVYTKKSPRKYIYLTRKRVLRLLDDTNKERLTLRLLQAHAKKYGLFQGAFRKYNGPLKELYDKKKGTASDTAIEEFAEEFGKKAKIGLYPLAKQIGVDGKTIKKRLKKWEESGDLIRGRDFETDALGNPKFYSNGVELIRNLLLAEGGC